ncbi:hypothetical protein IKQ19_13915 [Candidatus Saccharibacteria bacterium]|nr:hypothetical protein [Candidatus Saccharibacteria bacterium]
MSKRILLIAPVFFNYYKEIIRELELQGYAVDYVCDAPSNSNISKALGRINKSFIRLFTKRYFNKKVLPYISGKKYDYVLVVGGMTFAFSANMVKIIKDMNPQAKFVLYQWDSEKNLPYSTSIHPYFDVRFSFDRYDCKRGSKYHFLPLFYTKMYEEIGQKTTDGKYDYDCSYVGTAHPLKYKNINDIAKALKSVWPKQFIYHYMPSKLKYIYHKLTAPEYKNAKLSEFKLDKIAPKQMMEVFEKSKCVLDSPQGGQTGLTIRTLECLGAKKKMVTSNADIKYYDFYDETNILIFEAGKPVDTNSPFFMASYKDLPKDLYEKYSLRSWLKNLLEK